MTEVEDFAGGGYADKDPEDAWDDGDDDEFKILILERTVTQLDHDVDDRHEPRRVDALRLLGKLVPKPGTHDRLVALQDALEAL